MNEYVVYKIRDNDYCVLILGISFEGVLAKLSEIEQTLKNEHVTGWVVMDSLLKTGGGQNRFSSAYFDGKKILVSTTKNVVIPRESNIRKSSTYYLKSHPELLRYSILSEQQKKLIEHGVVI